MALRCVITCDCRCNFDCDAFTCAIASTISIVMRYMCNCRYDFNCDEFTFAVAGTISIVMRLHEQLHARFRLRCVYTCDCRLDYDQGAIFRTPFSIFNRIS